MREWCRLGAAWRHARLVVAGFALVASFAGIFPQSFWPPDEPREAEMGREMLAADFSARPTLSGEAHLEKPPLFFWSMAASYRLFGVHESAARVPGALFSAVTIVVAFALARRAGGRSAGLLAALVVASFGVFWSASHRAVTDVALTAFVALGHLLLLRGHDALRPGRFHERRTWAFAGAGACAALAFLTKGLVGPLLLVAPPLLAAAALREWTVVRRSLPRIAAWSALAIVVLAGPWAVALSRHPGGWQDVYECVFGQAIGRSLGDAEIGPHEQPPWYYFARGPVRLLPWTLVIPAMALSPAFRRWFQRPRARELAWLALAGLLLLSIPSGKRMVYVAPLLPAAAALPAAWLARARRDVPADRFTLGIALPGAVALAGLVIAEVGMVVAIFGSAWLPAACAPMVRDRPWIVGITAVVAAGLAAWSACSLATTIGRPEHAPPRLARSVAPLLGALLLASHAVVRPLVDPLHDLRPAALAISAAIPASAPVLAYDPSETLRAIVPFYAGRMVERAPTRDLAALLAQRGARHVVIEDKRLGRTIDAIPAGLRTAASIRGADEFAVTVFELAAPPAPPGMPGTNGTR